MAGAHVKFVIVDPHARLAGLEVYDLEQAVMLMRSDLPIVQDTALGDGFAVHHIRRQPMLVFAIQLEHRHWRFMLQGGRRRRTRHRRNRNLRKIQILAAKIHSHLRPAGAMMANAALASHSKETK
ncbi:MAG: hypothetical protein ACJ8G3_11775 [Burkholderiaceae bacterium]